MTWEYLAGFFDGEGSIFITKTKALLPKVNEYHKLRVSISQKKRDILDEIRKLIGFGNVYYSQEKSRSTKMHILKIEEGYVAKFLRRLLPYLRCKRMQARYAIQYWENRKTEHPLSGKELRWREMHRQLISLGNAKSMGGRKTIQAWR